MKETYEKGLESQNEKLRKKLEAVEMECDSLHAIRGNMGKFTVYCSLLDFKYENGIGKAKRAWDDYYINEMFKIKTTCVIEAPKLNTPESQSELFRFFRYTLFSYCYSHMESYSIFCRNSNSPKYIMDINDDVFDFVEKIEDVANKQLEQLQSDFSFALGGFSNSTKNEISHKYSNCKGGFKADFRTTIRYTPFELVEENRLSIFYGEELY